MSSTVSLFIVFYSNLILWEQIRRVLYSLNKFRKQIVYYSLEDQLTTFLNVAQSNNNFVAIVICHGHIYVDENYRVKYFDGSRRHRLKNQLIVR